MLRTKICALIYLLILCNSVFSSYSIIDSIHISYDLITGEPKYSKIIIRYFDPPSKKIVFKSIDDPNKVSSNTGKDHNQQATVMNTSSLGPRYDPEELRLIDEIFKKQYQLWTMGFRHNSYDWNRDGVITHPSFRRDFPWPTSRISTRDLITQLKNLNQKSDTMINNPEEVCGTPFLMDEPWVKAFEN